MTEQSQSAIVAEGLTKSFPGVRAVDHLSFDVRAGEIFGLVGPDGAGKTTTLRMLAGIMPPDEGTGSVAGFDVVHDPEGAKHHLSYMPQRFGLYEDLSVADNLHLFAELRGMKSQTYEEVFAKLLAFVKETRFDRLGAFAYSPEAGTPAAAITEGVVPVEVAQARHPAC